MSSGELLEIYTSSTAEGRRPREIIDEWDWLVPGTGSCGFWLNWFMNSLKFGGTLRAGRSVRGCVSSSPGGGRSAISSSSSFWFCCWINPGLEPRRLRTVRGCADARRFRILVGSSPTFWFCCWMTLALESRRPRTVLGCSDWRRVLILGINKIRRSSSVFRVKETNAVDILLNLSNETPLCSRCWP